MPYLIENIINQQYYLTTVTEEDTVTFALNLMIDNDYSQLPVIDKDGRLVGMVTYQSIIQAGRSFEIKVDELHVRDVIQKNIKYFDVEDNLFDLLDEIKKNNAVVIIEPDGTPVGMVTSYDASEFLRMRSEGLMRIENIEGTLKALILACHSTKVGQIDTERLEQAVQSMTDYRFDQNQTGRKPLTFNDLNLNDYINFVVQKSTWNYFEPILQIKREALITLLAKVREARNDMAHFRKEISQRNLDDLIYCAKWLESRYEKFSEARRDIEIQAVIEKYQQDKNVMEETEKPYEQKRQSVYAALANWLKEQQVNKVLLSFEQVEGILKRSLPASALELRAWWANDRVAHTHSVLWLNAGWRVESVSLSDRWVKFSRKQ